MLFRYKKNLPLAIKMIIIEAGAGVGGAGSSRLITPDWVWCLDSLSWLEFNLIIKLADITGMTVIKKCHQWPLTSSIIHSKQISFIFIHCIFYRVDLLLLSLMTAHSSSHSIRLGLFSACLEVDIGLKIFWYFKYYKFKKIFDYESYDKLSVSWLMR